MSAVLSGRRSRRRWAGTGASARRGRGAPRAFTILEVIIVLAILVAIGSLAIPPVWRWVEEYRSRETMARFEAAMDVCLARAQQRGVAMVVSVRDAGGVLRVEARELSPVAGDDERADDKPTGPAPLGVYSFPRGYHVDGSQPGARDHGSPSALAGGADDTDSARDFALLLPDGTAAAGGSLRLSDPRGRLCEVVIDRWGGEVRLHAVAAGVGESLSGVAADHQ